MSLTKYLALGLLALSLSASADVTSYSTTPANNNGSPPNGAPEGMAPGAVNDTIRQIMADIALEAQRNRVKVLNSVSGTNTITGVLAPSLTAYSTGMLVVFMPSGANDSAATLNINSLGARSILKSNGSALIANDLMAGMPAILVTSASSFILLNPQASINNIATTDFARLSQNNTFASSQVISTSSAAVRVVEGGITSKLQSGAGTGSGLVGTESNHPFEIRTNNVARATFTANGSDINLQATVVRANSSQICTANAVGCPAVSALSGSIGNGQVPQSAVTQYQSAINSGVAISATQITSNVVPDARISASSVTQHMGAGYARNITGKAGVTKTLSSSTPSGGSDGDVWYKY